MPRATLVIDARPRGPDGPLAGALVRGQPVLRHLVDLAAGLDRGPIAIFGRPDEHRTLASLLGDACPTASFRAGSPPEGSFVLRADRIYDPRRLERAARRGRDLESAVIWRLDAPTALDGAEAEIERRTTFQPLGSYWAIQPARRLARFLQPTRVRPNAVTAASAGLMFVAAAVVAALPRGWGANLSASVALAGALVLDTADGHLARLQGTSSQFGRWLDSTLDEWADMALHAAAAWSAFARDGKPEWLVLGMGYGMGKYLFMTGSDAWDPSRVDSPSSARTVSPGFTPRAAAIWLGHADVRWHVWIVLAACGRLDLALIVYAFYFPARAIAGFARKAVAHA